MTSISRTALGLVALVLITVSGCTAYRVSSKSVDSAPVQSSGAPVQVLLAQDNLPGRRYVIIGPIEVSVKKLTVFQGVITGSVDFELTLNGATFGPSETGKFGSGTYVGKAFTKSGKPAAYRIRVQYD